MKWLASILLLQLACFTPPLAQGAPYEFCVQSDEHLEFARELCLAALKAAGMDVRFSSFPVAQENRLNAELACGNLSIAFLPPDEDRITLEKQGRIKSLKVPLERGLLGYRICLVRDEDADMLLGVKNAADLKKIRIGQGIGWGDIAVYRNAGINVVEAPFNSMLDPIKALASGYYDALPLGVNEYMIFLQAYNKDASGITPDKHIVIRYPWFRFVWVSTAAENADVLLATLDKGFEIIASNGEFIAIYEKFKGTASRKQLVGRRTITLQSPYSTFDDIDPRFKHLVIQTPR